MASSTGVTATTKSTATAQQPAYRVFFLLLWVAVLVVAGIEFRDYRTYKEKVVLGPGVTKVAKLSDYYAPMKGSINDCNIYILDSGVPGGTFLLMGGTHAEEPSGYLTAYQYVENAMPKQGRLIVAIHDNVSASRNTRPGDAYPQFFTLTLSNGATERFRMGDRFASPLDSWPDPEVYVHYPSKQMLAYMDVRNFNRVWPGRADGMLAEKTTYAFCELMKKEKVTAVFDYHEAELEYSVISTIVAHQLNADVAAMASMTLSAEQFQIGMEYSPQALHGLSHREIGDHLGIAVFEPESPEPFLDRVRGATNVDLLLKGQDEFVEKAGEHGLLYEKITDAGWPIGVRVGRHVATTQKVFELWSQMHPDTPIAVDGLATYTELSEKGPGAFMTDPASVPADRIAYE